MIEFTVKGNLATYMIIFVKAKPKSLNVTVM